MKQLGFMDLIEERAILMIYRQTDTNQNGYLNYEQSIQALHRIETLYDHQTIAAKKSKKNLLKLFFNLKMY
jgi:hypothetical protein